MFHVQTQVGVQVLYQVHVQVLFQKTFQVSPQVLFQAVHFLIQVQIHQVFVSIHDKSLLTPVRQNFVNTVDNAKDDDTIDTILLLISSLTIATSMYVFNVSNDSDTILTDTPFFYHGYFSTLCSVLFQETFLVLPQVPFQAVQFFTSSTVTSSSFSNLDTSLLPPIRQQIYQHFCCSEKTTQVSMSFSIVVPDTNYIISFMIQE